MIIKNFDQLTDHGNIPGRKLALSILEAGLQAADPYQNVGKIVSREGNILKIGPAPEMDISGYGAEEIDLDQIEHIYVVGAGKAIQRQVKALEDILGDKLTAGVVVAKRGEGAYLSKVEVIEGAHPVPDAESYRGAKMTAALLEKATERDLVFTVFSSGSSSLCPLPQEGITLEDVQNLHRVSIAHGIQSVVLRIQPYISALNAGRVILMAHPARTVNLVTQVSRFPRWGGKIPEDGIWIHPWPPAARSHFAEDVAGLKVERWYPELPQRIREALESLDPSRDIPDQKLFSQTRHSYWAVAEPEQMLVAAQAKAAELGLDGRILGRIGTVTSADTAGVLMAIAQETASKGRPFDAPVALLSTGELIVPVGNAKGVGGRNQEFVLASSLRLSGAWAERVVVASIDSDGTDGPGTQLNALDESGRSVDFRCQAGGVADGQTIGRAKEAGIDLNAELREHNSSVPLFKLNDSIYTGNTGTCLGDLRVIVIS